MSAVRGMKGEDGLRAMAARIAAEDVGSAHTSLWEAKGMLESVDERLSSIGTACFQGYLRQNAYEAFDSAVMAAVDPMSSQLKAVLREMDRALSSAATAAVADPKCLGCCKKLSQCEC